MCDTYVSAPIANIRPDLAKLAVSIKVTDVFLSVCSCYLDEPQQLDTS